MIGIALYLAAGDDDPWTKKVADIPSWDLILQAILLLAVIGVIVWLMTWSARRRARRDDYLDEIRHQLDRLQNRVDAVERKPAQPRAVASADSQVIHPTSKQMGRGAEQQKTAPRQQSLDREAQNTAPPKPADAYTPPPEQLPREPAFDQIPVVVRQPAPKPTLFYAKNPESDGTFKMSNLTNEPTLESLYCLAVHAGGERAGVTLYRNEDRFRTALQSPRIYLDPVCIYPQQPAADARQIVEIEEGLAVAEGRLWRVQRRLEIEFR